MVAKFLNQLGRFFHVEYRPCSKPALVPHLQKLSNCVFHFAHRNKKGAAPAGAPEQLLREKGEFFERSYTLLREVGYDRFFVVGKVRALTASVRPLCQQSDLFLAVHDSVGITAEFPRSLHEVTTVIAWGINNHVRPRDSLDGDCLDKLPANGRDLNQHGFPTLFQSSRITCNCISESFSDSTTDTRIVQTTNPTTHPARNARIITASPRRDIGSAYKTKMPTTRKVGNRMRYVHAPRSNNATAARKSDAAWWTAAASERSLQSEAHSLTDRY